GRLARPSPPLAVPSRSPPMAGMPDVKTPLGVGEIVPATHRAFADRKPAAGSGHLYRPGHREPKQRRPHEPYPVELPRRGTHQAPKQPPPPPALPYIPTRP